MSQNPNSVQIKYAIPGQQQQRQVISGSRPSVIQLVQRPGTPQRLPVGSLPMIVRSSPGNTNTAVQYMKSDDGATFASPQQLGPVPSFMNFAPHGLAGFSLANSAAALMAQGGNPHMSGASAGSRKPCNCTKSNCLKLYCECFAQGQLCQNCNCNNCMNNLAHEEERRRAVKMTLERNPAAFNPKIGRGEGERRHTKGCNCKRSGCLKNYCECYEAKISCSEMCRCLSCKNTEDSIERRSLLRLAALGSYKSKHSSSYKKHLQEPAPETLPHSFLTWEVIEALVSCLLAQADDAERRDLPAAVQERLILEEFGRSVDLVIKSAGKAQVRTVNTASLLHGTPGGGTGPGGDDGDRFSMRRPHLDDDDLEEDMDDEIHEKFRPAQGSGRRRSAVTQRIDYLDEEDDDLEEDLPSERDIMRRMQNSERSIKTEAPDDEDDDEDMIEDNPGNESFSKPSKSSSGQPRKSKASSGVGGPGGTSRKSKAQSSGGANQSGSASSATATPTRTSGRRPVPSKRFTENEYQ